MILLEYFTEEQADLCREAGIIIEERDYNSEELYEMEHKLLEHINNNCMNEDFYMSEEKFDEIIDIIMDLENEEAEDNFNTVEFNENDHIELTNGKRGIIIDKTNNAYTIEIDEPFRTGNIDDDIVIVAENSIEKLV